jgi:O-antigen/teichoic acid export membrane protein
MLSGLTAIQATQSAGFYWGLTQPLYFIPLVFLFPLTTIILPATARAGTGEEALRRFWRKGRKLLALVFVYGVFSVLLLSFFGDEIAGILFNSTGSNRLLLMILPALPFSAINLLLSTMIEGLGKQGFLYQATLLAILIKTAVTTALVPLPGYRITGAAWGFLVSQIAYTLFLNGKMFRLGLGYSKILNKRRVTGIFRKTPPHHS